MTTQYLTHGSVREALREFATTPGGLRRRLEMAAWAMEDRPGRSPIWARIATWLGKP